MHTKTRADAHRRGGKDSIDIAALEFTAHQHISPGGLMQQWRAVLHRLFRIDHDGQRLEVNADKFERILGLIAALCNDADNGLADISHLVAR